MALALPSGPANYPPHSPPEQQAAQLESRERPAPQPLRRHASVLAPPPRPAPFFVRSAPPLACSAPALADALPARTTPCFRGAAEAVSAVSPVIRKAPLAWRLQSQTIETGGGQDPEHHFCPRQKDESVLPCVWLEMCLRYPGCVTESLPSLPFTLPYFSRTRPGPGVLCTHAFFITRPWKYSVSPLGFP